VIAVELDEVVRVIGGHVTRPLAGITVRGVSIDSRQINPGDLFFAIRGERFDGHDFVGAALENGAYAAVVADTGSEPPTPVGGDVAGVNVCASHSASAAADLRLAGGVLVRVPDTVAALGKLAAFHRTLLPADLIAVTGSNGKTTTKAMIQHVLATRLHGRSAIKSFNNNIGVPLTLLSADAKDEFVICEIGSNAPGEVAALGEIIGPNIAVVTSIGAAHLEKLGGIEGVAREKLSLLEKVRPGGLGVVNIDHPLVRPILDFMQRRKVADPPWRDPSDGETHACTLVTTGTSAGADIRVTDIEASLAGTTFRINQRFCVQLQICGAHHALNAACAFAVCRRLNLEPEEIIAALATFEPVAMRLNVERVGDVTLIDDCYNANPTSMAAALDLLATVRGGRRVAVLGDMLELGPDAHRYHQELGRLAAAAGIELIIAVGAMRLSLMAGAEESGADAAVVAFKDSEVAAGEISAYVRPADTVLVKASRAIKLERVTGAIRESAARMPRALSVSA
jgi:UDP-N-acetylmuramoyl-tripeptide--D-alanyl-D-alanine ligase